VLASERKLQNMPVMSFTAIDDFSARQNML